MKDILPGIKTKIMGWALAIGAMVDHVSAAYNPADIEAWLAGVNERVIIAYAGAGAAIQWFRSLAGKNG